MQEQQSRADSRREQIGLDLALLESELEEQRAILLESEDKYAALDEQLAVSSDALEAQKDRVTEAKDAGRKSILLLIRRGGEPRFLALPIDE